MQVSATEHSSSAPVAVGLVPSGSLAAMLVLVSCSEGVSGGSVSDESVNAAITTRSGSSAVGVASAVAASVAELTAETTSGVSNEIGGLSAKLASAVRDCARRLTGAAPVASIPINPDAAIQARTKAGIATSRHNG